MDNLKILRMVEALGVVLLDKRIRGFLLENDPMAFRQCFRALKCIEDEFQQARSVLQKVPAKTLARL
jgi:hypothetical protein